MAVVALTSTAIANATAKPKVMNSANISRGKQHQSIGYCAVGAADSILSTYRLMRIRSSDRLASLSLFCTAITSAAANVGLYDTADNGGAIVGGGAQFAAAQSLASALNGVSITYSVIPLSSMEKRIWEVLGLASDPGKDYDIVVTLTAAATAAGTVGIHMTAVSGE